MSEPAREGKAEGLRPEANIDLKCEHFIKNGAFTSRNLLEGNDRAADYGWAWSLLSPLTFLTGPRPGVTTRRTSPTSSTHSRTSCPAGATSSGFAAGRLLEF